VKSASAPWVLCTIQFACCLALAGAVGYLEPQRQAQAKRIVKLEADVRTVSGKLYDQQERQGDELEAARGENAVALWKAQTDLEACRKGRPS
jgi:hypothetical protein